MPRESPGGSRAPGIFAPHGPRRRAVPQRGGSHTPAALVPGALETVLVPELDHILRHQAGTPTLKTYKTDVHHPVDPRVSELVTSWVARRVAAPA